jgi:hypothetical protein
MISSDRRCALSRADRDGADGAAVDDEGQEVALTMIELHYPAPNGITLRKSWPVLARFGLPPTAET